MEGMLFTYLSGIFNQGMNIGSDIVGGLGSTISEPSTIDWRGFAIPGEDNSASFDDLSETLGVQVTLFGFSEKDHFLIGWDGENQLELPMASGQGEPSWHISPFAFLKRPRIEQAQGVSRDRKTDSPYSKDRRAYVSYLLRT